MTITPAQPRRWLRFSLRTMLILVLLVALLLGAIRKAQQQGRAVAELQKVGCRISYGDKTAPTTPLELLRKMIGEDEPRNALELGIDRGESYCVMFPNGDSALTAPGPNGRELLTDAALVHLSALPHLETLSLKESKVTDVGLVRLGELTQLKSLALTKTHVTDAGLAPLKRLTRLQWLDLSGTQVTKAGIAELLQALPGLRTSPTLEQLNGPASAP